MSARVPCPTCNTGYREKADDECERCAQVRVRLLASPLTDRFYYASEAAVLSCVGYRSIDYWVRTGRMVPTTGACGSGSRRTFSLNDIQRLRLVGQRLEWGMTLDAAFREREGPPPPALSDVRPITFGASR